MPQNHSIWSIVLALCIQCPHKLFPLMIFLSGYFRLLFFLLFHSSLKVPSAILLAILLTWPFPINTCYHPASPYISRYYRYSLTCPFTLLFSSSSLCPFLEKHRQSKWAKAAARDSVIDKSLLATDRELLSCNHSTNWLKCLLVSMHSHSLWLVFCSHITQKESEGMNEWK